MSAPERNPDEVLVMLFSDSADQHLEARLRWHRFILKQHVQAAGLALTGLDVAMGGKVRAKGYQKAAKKGWRPLPAGRG